MDYTKITLASTENYKMTYHTKGHSMCKKCIITFGEIDSTLEEAGFGSKLIMDLGFDHIYVAQKLHTQYQFLTADNFYKTVKDIIADKEVYTYGSSLGGYCAIYYGGVINANILAMSPRIPAHPVINQMMGNIFKNKGFYHKELTNEKKTTNRVAIFYDKNNYIDSYYIDVFVKPVYPNADYFHVEYAGHYAARALLLSGELKKIAIDFFHNKELTFTLDKDEIISWHIQRTKKRIKQGKFFHARENLDVLLTSHRAQDKTVRDLVDLYREKLLEKHKKRAQKRNNPQLKLYSTITKEEEHHIKNAVSLSFLSNLFLSRRAILNAYNPKTGNYEFNSMFDNVQKYLKEADFSIATMEGVMAGVEKKDGLRSELNYPDHLAFAVRKAGIDFVSTAHDYILDFGIKSAKRTLNILDKAGLNHSGFYRNKREKEKLPIFKIKGLKVAILTYTKTSTRYKTSFFLKTGNQHLTSILVPPNNKNFDQVKNEVLQDFQRVKKANPDCIIVLSHMGQQYKSEPNLFQKTWCNIFIDAGADIIVNHHPCKVQPYEWRKKPGEDKDVLIIHSPGHFVNSFHNKYGDSSALTQVYLDPKNGKPFAISCIPLYSHAYIGSNDKALPIYEIIHHKKLGEHLSTFEFDHISETHEFITNTMFNEKLSIDQIQEKYYLFANRASSDSKGYVRNRVQPLEINEEMKKNVLYKMLLKSKSVCFVGDSITEGTLNGGYGWYEPLIENFKHLDIEKFTKRDGTSTFFMKHADRFAKYKSDLYIIAIGTKNIFNDKRETIETKDYISDLEQIVKKIKSESKRARIVFITPWPSDVGYFSNSSSKAEYLQLMEEYITALEKYANSSGLYYINPNPVITAKFKTKDPKNWLKDWLHPNAAKGIELYSYAVIKSAPKNRLTTIIKRFLK